MVDLERVPDVGQWVGVEHDQVGALAGFEHPEVGFPDRWHQAGAGGGGGDERLHRRQSGFHVQLQLVVCPPAHRHVTGAAVGAQRHRNAGVVDLLHERLHLPEGRLAVFEARVADDVRPCLGVVEAGEGCRIQHRPQLRVFQQFRMLGEMPVVLADRQRWREGAAVVETQLQELVGDLRVVHRDAGPRAEGPHGAVQEILETGLDQLHAIGFLVDVGHRDEAVLDRLLDDRRPDFWRDLESRVRHVVDPHLDEVCAECGLLPNQLACLLFRGGGVRGARVEAVRVREAPAGGERSWQVRPPGVGLEHQGHLRGVVTPDAPRGGHAVVQLRPERPLGRRQISPVVGMQVYQPRDNRLSGRIDDLCALGHGGGVSRTGGLHATVANDDDRVGDRIPAGAVDELGPDDDQARGLAGRRWALRTSCESRESEKGDESFRPNDEFHDGGHHSIPSFQCLWAARGEPGRAARCSSTS